MAPQELTEYERKRLENIRRNDEMMAALKIHSKVNQLSAETKRQRDVTKSYSVNSGKKPKTETPIVIRRSLRTRGMEPDYLDRKGLNEDVLDTVAKFNKPPTKSKFSPKTLGPLAMADAYSGIGSDRLLIEAILGFQKKKAHLNSSIKKEFGDWKDEDLSSHSVEGSDGVSFDTDERKGDEVKSCLKLRSLTLRQDNIARIVPGRITSVKIFPSSYQRMIVAGNKFGNIGFWNVDSGKEDQNGVYLYHPHSGPISGILPQRHCLSKIYTSCYDGFIRLMDAEKEVFDLVFSGDETIFSMSQQTNERNCLYFSEGRSGLNTWDCRVGECSSQWILHEDRINSIDFNSENPHIMATSSTDGTACIWDLRSIDGDKPKTLRTFRHNRAVHSAYFSPSGNSLATTSMDNTIGVYSGVNFEDVSSIYHNNQTGRWISSFKAIWGWDDSYIFVGNMKRGVDVISPARMKTIWTLHSPYISAIPCRFDAHPFTVGMLAGATSGGQVYTWTMGALTRTLYVPGGPTFVTVRVTTVFSSRSGTVIEG
ncbi:WD repeat-containing protein 76 [Quillaja saponaria]|uniref:WD repeat-containing protein 76 n=1 Tax=Quillaja saponaria TaxID=32244 RepID=A0AAD7LCH9_QUISA|nr:WD repeat-containing protein 76 [Quillaja saponaria]